MQFSSNVIRNPIRMGLLLEFKTAFPEEEPLTIEQYLKGGNKDFILNVVAFLLGFKNHDSKYDNNKELIKVFFGPHNGEIAEHLNGRIKALEKTRDKVGIINPYSSLLIFEYFFKRPADLETQSYEEFEVNFFKAYLVANSKFTEAQKMAFKSTEGLGRDLAFPMMIFCMNYPTSDKQHYSISEIWLTQLYKAILLFQFLENNKKTLPLYNAFLDYFNVKDWQEYLKSFMPLTISMIKNESYTDFTVQKDVNYEKSCIFFDKLIVKDEEDLNEFDFLTLRSKPFYKVEEGVYRIIFNLFVVEKIFKGMYFLLRDVNSMLPEKNQVKALKSLYGDYFSEQVVLYNVIDTIYPNKCIKFSGQDLVKLKILAGPDYYVRKRNDIMIFESKDFLIPADAKMSFDYARYQDEFEKKLYFEMVGGKEKHVGIMQLIPFIKRLLRREFEPDNKYNYKEISIYPIIVVHDHQYNVPGFNTLINNWFQAELELLAEEGFYVSKVKPLVIINIDSLIYHQVGLVENIPLHEVLKEYSKHIWQNKFMKFRSEDDLKAYVLSKQVAFSTFISEYFRDNNLTKIPPILEMVAPILFKEGDTILTED